MGTSAVLCRYQRIDEDISDRYDSVRDVVKYSMSKLAKAPYLIVIKSFKCPIVSFIDSNPVCSHYYTHDYILQFSSFAAAIGLVMKKIYWLLPERAKPA
jgi:hypothetical protein